MRQNRLIVFSLEGYLYLYRQSPYPYIASTDTYITSICTYIASTYTFIVSTNTDKTVWQYWYMNGITS